jgi:hypothetical protein
MIIWQQLASLFEREKSNKKKNWQQLDSLLRENNW